MATFDGIAGLSTAVIGYLSDAFTASSPNISESNIAPGFKLLSISDFEDPSRLDESFTLPVVSLCLYRVAINTSMRNAPRQLRKDGVTYAAPLPLDLFYLLTAWAKNAAVQQRLLGWAMRTLHDLPTWPAPLLNHYSIRPDVFDSEESVDLTLDPLGFQDMTTLWDKLKPKMQLSATYIARVVVLNSDRPLAEEHKPAQTRVFALPVELAVSP